MMLIRGIDIAYYDAVVTLPGGVTAYLPMEWNKYDWDFVFIKCSEGTIIDGAFRQQWNAARGFTIRGAYHYFRPFVDPLFSARKMADYLNGDMGELPVVLDLETTDGRSDCIARALAWLTEFQRLTHIRPIIYSSLGFLNTVQASNYSILGDYKLWLAQYPLDNLDVATRKERIHATLIGARQLLMPLPPRPFKRISFLQWTGKGDPNDVPGYIASKLAVDFNFYNGPSVEDMIREFSIKWIPKPQGEEMAIYGKIINAITNIRSSLPGGAYADIGDLPIGTLIEASHKEIVNSVPWYKITKATYNNADVKTAAGRLVAEVEAWVFGANVQEYSVGGSTLPEIPVTITLGDDIAYSRQTVNIILKPKVE
jgi:GH25 family lysozyme M1 (1,4-beta-N-acetylmuramidase)